jgi:hypothetical protein
VHLYFHSIHRSQTKERRGDGHVASGEGALWDALQALHQETGQRILEYLNLNIVRKCWLFYFVQWDKYPAELDAAVLARLPYREDRDDRYLTTEATGRGMDQISLKTPNPKCRLFLKIYQ